MAWRSMETEAAICDRLGMLARRAAEQNGAGDPGSFYYSRPTEAVITPDGTVYGVGTSRKAGGPETWHMDQVSFGCPIVRDSV